jgi:hypothetical protein
MLLHTSLTWSPIKYPTIIDLVNHQISDDSYYRWIFDKHRGFKNKNKKIQVNSNSTTDFIRNVGVRRWIFHTYVVVNP